MNSFRFLHLLFSPFYFLLSCFLLVSAPFAHRFLSAGHDDGGITHQQHHEYHELNESESTPRNSRTGSNESNADLGVNAKGEPELVTHLL